MAICKCLAHAGKSDPISQGNAFADQAAKEAASQPKSDCAIAEAVNTTVLHDQQQHATKQEKDLWIKEGATLDKDNIYK